MALNQFTWINYKQTDQGKEMIRLFADGKPEAILSRFDKHLSLDYQTASEFVDELINYATLSVCAENLSFDAATDLVDQLATTGLTLSYEDNQTEHYSPEDFDFLELIAEISTWLYAVYPDIFKPYYFKHNFTLLTRIADTFDMNLPVIPLKRYKKDRLLYYVQLCQEFSLFQLDNGLTAPEFCAFLYDFAPNYLDYPNQNELPLPKPTQVWWIGGNKAGGDFEFVDQATPADTHFWQGNQDTRRGDILILYCLAPRSYIHSIWRATTDGITDPFFYYYSCIHIGFGQKVPPITIQELKSDSHFRLNPLIKKNLQGINGYPFSAQDYDRLKLLIQAKETGQLSLPQLDSHRFTQNKELTRETEVEAQLLEPLLIKLGYSQTDWVRQFTIRMGRGERNFPDYAFQVDKTKGYEKAGMLIECKLYIQTNRQLDDAFKQVWSYGQRLRASTLVIADKDALWVYQNKPGGFDRTRHLKLTWGDLEQPDTFNQLKKLIGKKST